MLIFCGWRAELAGRVGAVWRAEYYWVTELSPAPDEQRGHD